MLFVIRFVIHNAFHLPHTDPSRAAVYGHPRTTYCTGYPEADADHSRTTQLRVTRKRSPALIAPHRPFAGCNVKLPTDHVLYGLPGGRCSCTRTTPQRATRMQSPRTTPPCPHLLRTDPSRAAMRSYLRTTYCTGYPDAGAKAASYPTTASRTRTTLMRATRMRPHTDQLMHQNTSEATRMRVCDSSTHCYTPTLMGSSA
jgi:hypothetical protein